jgi:hypothetical protein
MLLVNKQCFLDTFLLLNVQQSMFIYTRERFIFKTLQGFSATETQLTNFVTSISNLRKV